MICTLCVPYLNWLSFDGVSLAFNKNKVLWNTVESIFPKDGTIDLSAASLLKQKDRMLLLTASTC